MMMLPDKPKRDIASRHSPQRIRMLLAGLLLLPMIGVPLVQSQLPSGQLLDALLIGIMLCSGLYLTYEGVTWFIAQASVAGDDGENVS